jgi:hypothetical protein
MYNSSALNTLVSLSVWTTVIGLVGFVILFILLELTRKK